jgi:hypothetical protein
MIDKQIVSADDGGRGWKFVQGPMLYSYEHQNVELQVSEVMHEQSGSRIMKWSRPMEIIKRRIKQKVAQ